jgi:excisionase family DNA binding protein
VSEPALQGSVGAAAKKAKAVLQQRSMPDGCVGFGKSDAASVSVRCARIVEVLSHLNPRSPRHGGRKMTEERLTINEVAARLKGQAENGSQQNVCRYPYGIDNPMKAVLTPKELAKELRVSASQVSRLAALGKIPGARDLGTGTNHKWRFTEEIVDRWLMEERQPARHEPSPRRRTRKITPVQHNTNAVSQTIQKQEENRKAHGTEYPVNEL